MSYGRGLAGAASVVLVLCLGGSAVEESAAAIGRQTPHTLVVVAGAMPAYFAATPTHAAWTDYVSSCRERVRRVHIFVFRRSRPNTLPVPLCQYGDHGPVAIAGGDAVWVQWSAGNTSYEGRVLRAGPGDSKATTLLRFNYDRGGTYDPWVTVASDGKGAVIANDGSVLRVVGRRTRLVFGGTGSNFVAVAGNRIGVIRPQIQADVDPGRPPIVEVHERTTGATVADFEANGVSTIAVSTQTIAVARGIGDNYVLLAYDGHGKHLANRRVGNGGEAMGIVGARIVYHGGRRIYAWNPRSGANARIAISRRPIMDFVVTGQRAIWTERLDSRHFAIVSLAISTR